MHDEFTPLLTTTDWNEEWKELQKVRRHADDARVLGQALRHLHHQGRPEPLRGAVPGATRTSAPAKRCSTWAAAPALWPCRSARRGTRWWPPTSPRACWIRCRRGSTRAGVRTVFPKLMSWEDDWPAFGVREGMTDVAIASRSIATADLRDSLLRLTDVARRRVCITLATGSSPRVDERILAAVGLPIGARTRLPVRVQHPGR